MSPEGPTTLTPRSALFGPIRPTEAPEGRSTRTGGAAGSAAAIASRSPVAQRRLEPGVTGEHLRLVLRVRELVLVRGERGA